MQTLINIFWSVVVTLLLLLGFGLFSGYTAAKLFSEHRPVSSDVVARASAEIWNEVEVAQIQKQEADSWFSGVSAWIFGSETPDLVELPEVSAASHGSVEAEKMRIYNQARYDLYTRPMDQEFRIEQLDVVDRAIKLNR